MKRDKVRAFAPLFLSAHKADEQVKCMIEGRLACTGQWVQHCPSDGDPQFVVMNYQFMPQSEEYEGIARPSASPVLYGLIDHFECTPEKYQDRRGKDASGSKFIIGGVRHIVKSVHVNSRCGVKITLQRDDKCIEPDQEWIDIVEGLSPCSHALNCADT